MFDFQNMKQVLAGNRENYLADGENEMKRHEKERTKREQSISQEEHTSMKDLAIKSGKSAGKMFMPVMVGLSMVSLATIISPMQLYAADEKSPDKMVLAPMVKAPTIDGKIADGS